MSETSVLQQPPSASAPGRRATHRMLIVEDHASTSHALRGIFTRLGWDVTLAATVAEGLARLDEGPEPCCLILDLDLPDGPGEAILGHVRDRGLRTRVVVATGNALPPRLNAVARLGADAILHKPIDLGDVWDGRCRVCPGD